MPRGEPKESPAFPALSKRAARRLIQRAWVLVGRDRSVRQHLREASLSMLWVLENWQFEWTVAVNRGELEFHRGRVGKPNLTLVWPTAAGFFDQVRSGELNEAGFEHVKEHTLRRLLEPLLKLFCNHLNSVLQYPFDDAGERLW